MKRLITPRGAVALRAELEKLKQLRPEIALAIEEARAHGDISENADYQAAKERSGMIEAKIRDIESRLSMIEEFDPKNVKSTAKVVFGLTVEVENLADGGIQQLTIVGADESNVEIGLISIESPLGRALIGKSAGDTVSVNLPSGSRDYLINKIFLGDIW
ncbi:MAG TPA: transcription elongation factor GreA [Oligoflexia bacterium]|nr:transcription elongation factor GreA [Oligoflexia bacterium]HMP27147.1 transcription elongation factor GreA [Oligoflexia bacterium]